MEQDAYTLEEPIETIACEEPLWGAFEGGYDAVFYVWEKYKNNAVLSPRMRKGIGQVLGDRKSEQFDHTMNSFFVSQYNLWRKMVSGINTAIQKSECPEAVSALVSVSEKDSCYVIGRFEKTKFSFESGLRDDQFNMGEINPVQFIKFEA